MKPSVAKFEHSLATYPTRWKQYVISPKKICVQFDAVQCKTRSPHHKEGLRKTRHGTWEMPIDTHGTDINTLAVGIPTDLYPILLQNILKAIEEHAELYPENSIKANVQEILNGFKS